MPWLQAIHTHPNFFYNRRINDIALLELNKPVRGVKLAKLAPADTVRYR